MHSNTSSSKPALAIRVPAVQSVQMHGQTAVVSFPVTDTGTQPVVIAFQVANLNARALARPGATWLALPKGFTLQPGQTAQVRLHLHRPAGSPETVYTNLVTEAAGTAQGVVVAQVATASTIAITGTPAPVPVTPGPASPPVLMFGGGAALAAVAAVVVGLRLRKRQERRRADARQRVEQGYQPAGRHGKHAESWPRFGNLPDPSGAAWPAEDIPAHNWR